MPDQPPRPEPPGPNLNLEQLHARVEAAAQTAAWSDRILLRLCLSYLVRLRAGWSFLRFLKGHLPIARPSAAQDWLH